MRHHNYIGFKEIWTLLGTSKTRAQQIIDKQGFPKPVPGPPPFEELGMGRLWNFKAVQRWIEKNR